MRKPMVLAVLSIIGFAFIGCATAQGTYINDDGSTFTQSFSGLFSANVPATVVKDTFLQSEIIDRYNENTQETYQEPSLGNTIIGGVGGDSGTVGRMYAIIDTYEVTVTRYWYDRTTYYQDRMPEYSRIYKDQKTRRLIGSEKVYL